MAPAIIPEPAALTLERGRFELTPASRIVIVGDPASAQPVGDALAADLRPATGYRLPVLDGSARQGDITLTIGGAGTIAPDATDEAYALSVRPGRVALGAPTAHGLFDGIQTIRQLLPPWIASPDRQPGPWTMPAVRIIDRPRYGYRGYMLDIARHYEPPAVVERLIDEISAYKIDVLHLHLSDDQGFRIAVGGFPRLTEIGALGAVGTHGRTMDPGGFWTQDDYRAVVAYAAAHFVTVVPEIDSPGHTNAIIMSEYGDSGNPLLDGHPQSINCTTHNPPAWNYTIDVGYSALCPESPDTWTILTAIIDQLSAMSPGPYYDLGGDEVPSDVLSQARYAAFVNDESSLVAATGKTVMGWADIAGPGTNPPAGSVAEYWQPASGSGPDTITAREAVAKRLRLVMAPANRTYLDEKYVVRGHHSVPPGLGMNWACPQGCDVSAFYAWDPAHLVTGVSESDVIGVEAPLFGETVVSLSTDEYMTFPRLLASAEIGWSPYLPRTRASTAYGDFLSRLAAQGARLLAGGVNFYPSSEVAWPLVVEPNPAAAVHGREVNGAIATLAAPGVRPGAITGAIDWGDGTTAQVRIGGRAPAATAVGGLYRVLATHRYATGGRHLVTLVLRAPAGRRAAVRFVVTT